MNRKTANRLVKLQKEYKAIYEDGYRTLCGINNYMVQLRVECFIEFARENDLEIVFSHQHDSKDYYEFYFIYQGVKFIALFSNAEVGQYGMTATGCAK